MFEPLAKIGGEIQHRVVFAVAQTHLAVVELLPQLRRIGRSPWLQSVHIETPAQPGDIVTVTLVAAGPNSMTGALRQKEAA